MHVPTKTWLSNNPLYKTLARYHYLHHKYPGRNFNIVCPLADHLTRCVAKAKPEDLKMMKELNLT
jgi:sterol desaturase/sphingolipid hydroxylase (fatty acid hydroxylase superfamily)